MAKETDTLDDSLRSQLIALAQAAALERGWSWREPVQITSTSHRGVAAWELRTNFPLRGSSAKFFFQKSDLAIIHAGYLPR